MAHLSDLEIANQSTLRPIGEIAKKAGIPDEALEQYGHYKAKIDINKVNSKGEKGKVVLVTAMSPTPAGEGKSTVTVGLADAFNELNKNVMVALREPALGPTFGIKAVQQVVAMHKCCQWKILTYTLMVTSMRLQQQTTHYQHLLIIIFIKAMN